MNNKRWISIVSVMAFALGCAQAFAAKPPPTTADPCAPTSPSYAQNWDGFPSFAYVVVTNATNRTPASHEVRLASRNGVCSRRIGDSLAGRGERTAFARNGGQYVVAWLAAGRVMTARFASSTAVPGSSPIAATVTVFRPYSTSIDLSPDASRLVYSYIDDATYPSFYIRVADLGVTDASADATLQQVLSGESFSLWWAPWGRVYYNPMDGTNGKRIRSLDPSLPATQVPQTLLTVPAIAPLAVNTLFQIGQLTGGFVGSRQAVVFQGYYTTSVKQGGTTGSWCVAAYAIDANGQNAFVLGSMTAPSAVGGFDFSATGDSTVVFSKSTAPASGSSCSRTGYIGEQGLDAGATPSILGQIAGTFPAALKMQ